MLFDSALVERGTENYGGRADTLTEALFEKLERVARLLEDASGSSKRINKIKDEIYNVQNLVLSQENRLSRFEHQHAENDTVDEGFHKQLSKALLQIENQQRQLNDLRHRIQRSDSEEKMKRFEEDLRMNQIRLKSFKETISKETKTFKKQVENRLDAFSKESDAKYASMLETTKSLINTLSARFDKFDKEVRSSVSRQHQRRHRKRKDRSLDL